MIADAAHQYGVPGAVVGRSHVLETDEEWRAWINTPHADRPCCAIDADNGVCSTAIESPQGAAPCPHPRSSPS